MFFTPIIHAKEYGPTAARRITAGKRLGSAGSNTYAPNGERERIRRMRQALELALLGNRQHRKDMRREVKLEELGFVRKMYVGGSRAGRSSFFNHAAVLFSNHNAPTHGNGATSTMVGEDESHLITPLPPIDSDTAYAGRFA